MRHLVRRTAALTAGTLGLFALLGGPALADAPTKSGWWNAATANGVALPQPTTGADELHVGQGAGGPSAYAALTYDLAGLTVSAATLELKVVANSAVGAIDVAACPTRDATWKAGGNQPYDTRPAYDCAKGVAGTPAADGTTVTFLLGTAQQLAAGGYSLAIVPADGAAPFSVNFAKPDASTLSPQVEEPPAAPAAPFEPPPAAGTSGTAPLAAGTVAQAPAGQVPALAGPVVPGPVAAAAPAPPGGTIPVAAAQPAAPVSDRDRYAAGTLLALLAGALVWAFQQPSSQPRLIGGLARKAGRQDGPVVDASPRGIGRFATLRTAPPRRLL